MSQSKGQDQGADIDELIKDAGKVLDSWKKAIDDIAKDLAKLGDGKGAKGGNADKGDKGDKSGKGDDSKKLQEQAQKDADDASKKLSEDLKKMLQGQKPPSDPKQLPKLTDFMEKYIDKNGIKLKDWGSVKPDIDIDPKKMQIKKLGVQWTWKF